MRALHNPQLFFSLSSISPPAIHTNRSLSHSKPPQAHLIFFDHGRCLIRSNNMTVKAVLDNATIEQLRLKGSDIRNPAISTPYRIPEFEKPNQTVLEAQGKVCTGPKQTRPLSEEQAFKVLDTVLRQVKSKLTSQADPKGSLMGAGSSIGSQYGGNNTKEMRLVGALREILIGGHLGYEEVQGVLKDVLPLNDGNNKSSNVSESLVSAFLIGQRMNRETDRELKAYCLAFDDEIGPPPVADDRTLTHYHEGYEEPLLMLMKRRGVHSGLVVKGEEGALSMTTRLRTANASKELPVNYCSGFRSLSMESACKVDGVSCENVNLEVNTADYGFEPTDTPRTDRSVSKNIELGLATLDGQKGPAYDQIVINAGMVDHLLGCNGAEDASVAMDRAREAIDSGKALKKLLNYIKMSHKIK